MPRLVVFAGLPGTGKSTLAEGIGRALNIPVFAKDWLEAALRRSGITREMNSGWAGYELLGTLAERQLRLGQSAILDCVLAKEDLRRKWRNLAAQHGAAFHAIECLCSDEALHRSRVEGRERGIPGWYELEWAEVERVREYYEPWQGTRLRVDCARPSAENFAAVMRYLQPEP